jgi:hypothetical protein
MVKQFIFPEVADQISGYKISKIHARITGSPENK